MKFVRSLQRSEMSGDKVIESQQMDKNVKHEEEKRMVSEHSGTSLKWCTVLLKRQPLKMTGMTSEQCKTIAGENDDERNGETGEKKRDDLKVSITDGERKGEGEENKESRTTQQAKVDALESVEARLKSQENKMNNLIKIINKMCTTYATAMEHKFTETIKEIRKELVESKNKRPGIKSIEELKNLISEHYAKQFSEMKESVIALQEVVETLSENQEEQVEDEEEVRKTNQNNGKKLWPTKNTNLKDDVSKIIEENLNDNSPNSFTEVVSETLQFEIKRDYKLTRDIKFEQFYDYLSSELRSSDLLYVIDEKIKSDITNEYTLNLHKFIVRDIIINRLENFYYSKVMEFQNPMEIVAKLKEMKRCENNATSFDIKKELCNMKIDKEKAELSVFCERFEDLIRSYENSPNATPLSDDEKRNIFYYAVKESVPTLETTLEIIEFVIQNSKGNGTSTDKKGEVRDAKLVQLKAIKCYKCQAYGHFAAMCLHKGKGPLCYNCNNIGHRAYECPSQLNHVPRPLRARSIGCDRDTQDNNVNRSTSEGDFVRRNLKRKTEGGHTYFTKRGRVRDARGTGRYDILSTRENEGKGKRKTNPKRYSEPQNQDKENS